MVILFNFLRNGHIVFQSGYIILHFYWGSGFFTSSLTLIIICHLIIVILMGVKWYVIVVLNFIFLMTNDVMY